ncbi:MAG: hypothetical protein GY865_14570 [candidate division Zixibacteria bacterium]|nr:hypothetical protein [candidate division Zixibacteria bacterium]
MFNKFLEIIKMIWGLGYIIFFLVMILNAIFPDFSMWILIPSAIVIYVFIIFTYVSITEISKIIKGFKEKQRKKNELCPHGIKGGYHFDLCENCIEDKKQEERRKISEEKAAQVKNEILGRAEKLRNTEIRRLSRINIGKLEYLLSLDPKEFENIVAKMYSNMGYKVIQTKFSNDRGKDAIATKNGKKYLIECKRYALGKNIGRPPMQKFFAAMFEEKADGGIFVTTSDFASTGVKYASENKIKLINGEELSIMMQKAFPEENKNQFNVMCEECGEVLIFALTDESNEHLCSNGHAVSSYNTIKNVSVKLLTGKKYCRRCGKELRVINSYRGTFWGCSGYPKCRYTENY